MQKSPAVKLPIEPAVVTPFIIKEYTVLRQQPADKIKIEKRNFRVS